MNISYEQIGHRSVTFPAAESCQAGQVCKIDTQGKAAACAAGDRFCGMAESVKDGRAAVQIGGFVEVPYSSTAPAMGYTGLSANGSGGVKADSAANKYLVVQVNTENSTVVLEL